jgi:hypothetical protein
MRDQQIHLDSKTGQQDVIRRLRGHLHWLAPRYCGLRYADQRRAGDLDPGRDSVGGNED